MNAVIPRSFRAVEPGIFHDAHLGLVVQAAEPNYWVMTGRTTDADVLAVGRDFAKTMQRAGQVATKTRKAAQNRQPGEKK